MTRPLKVDSLAQTIVCPACRLEAPLEDFPRGMNFTTGTVRFTCRACHREIGRLGFSRWNALRRRGADSAKENQALPSQAERTS